MNLISWNINGIRAIAKKGFLDAIRELDPDILCLQEIKADTDTVAGILSELEGYRCYVNPAEKKGYSGTALLSRPEPLRVDTGPQGKPFLDEGRIQCADYGEFFLVNAYVPNSGQGLKRLDYREAWDWAFLKYLRELQAQKPVVLCGDLNVAHKPIDLKNDKANYNKTAGYTQVEIDGMDRLLQAGFLDTFRELNPDREAYSYWSYRFNARERNIGWRIDYFLVSRALQDRVKDASIHAGFEGSDHCPIGLHLDS
ncbi:exodeoxyribonuclease III [Robiginitalea marina]|uniref:Exodeoxyribonuclease III n=1 Tax=Robiginitalea marina TaxID=2954105 RepID=A0ABT1AUM8_9FLAO|nr:exodeoxyribonuclease III [Robiginitalea marina]MCO5723260.1 exodeoxyribonuclease III [Robiginitalea marina]